MNLTLRRAAITATAAALASTVLLPQANATPAHPLGNFTVNYHTGLTLHSGRVEATAIIDRAEISTLQERPRIDLDHDGDTTPAEITTYSRATCNALGRQLHVDVDARPVGWKPSTQGLTYERGEAGLQTSRLTCNYTASADLTRPADITLHTAYDTRRIGWREMTVRGQGLRITATDLPAISPTDELRHYPQNPLAAPLNQHTAQLHTEPGTTTTTASGSGAPQADWASGILDAITARFDSLIGAHELTVSIGLLALLLALVLGASHAVLPGHGKTIMAAYLAGRRGTKRDAVTVGATVTLTHTTGVLVLGLALPTATHLAGETILTWLGAASGLIVTGVGLWLLTSALRGRPSQNHHHGHGHHHHHHDDESPHDHPAGHDHYRQDGHDHSHPRRSPRDLLPRRRHPGEVQQARPGALATLVKPDAGTPSATSHQHGPRPTSHQHGPRRRAGRGGLIGMGIAGGLVPSPSALVVLLGAIALGRTAFGVLLVVAYGLGMAATLTVAGLLLVRLRERIEGRAHSLSTGSQWALRNLSRIGPLATSLLVVLVGLGLTLRALTSAA